MTTITASASATRTSLHPFVTGAIGAVVFGTAMAVGEAFDLNAVGTSGERSSTSAMEWLVTAGIAAVGLAIALALGSRAWNGDLKRLARTATGLAIAGAVLIVAFWSGWPSTFSAVALGLALEHRRRIGSIGGGIALVAALAVAVSVFAAFICVTG